MKTDEKQLAGKVLRRGFTMGEKPVVDMEARTVEVAFSSEEPYLRPFGYEIIDHDDDAMDLSRLKDGAAVLVDHDTKDLVGVVNDARVDSDRRGRAVLRFGRSERAREIMQDVGDGIRKLISFGYEITGAEKEKDEINDIPAYRVRTKPLEISFVAVPADATVGVGRSFDPDRLEEKTEKPREEKAREPVDKPTETKNMTDEKKVESPAPEPVDLTAVRDQAARDERERVAKINELAGKFKMNELGQKFISSGHTVEDFRSAMLDALPQTKPMRTDDAEIGLTPKEAREFSFVKAIRAQLYPEDRRMREAASFEREVSNAAAEQYGRQAQGFMVPMDVMLARDLSAGTNTAGGHLVETQLRPQNFIEILRNRTVCVEAGAMMLPGLVGDVAIPKQDGAGTGYWVSSEGGAPTESNQTFAQVTLAPKTLGTYVDMTRQLILQSTPAIEQLVRADLARVIAIEIDNKALYGSGSSGQPTGVSNASGVNTAGSGLTAFAAADPTFAEIIAMESACGTDNALSGSLGYITDAAMRGAFKTTAKDSGSGLFVWEPGGSVNGYPVYVTEQVTDGDVFFGNWNDLMIGMWGGLDLTADPYTSSNTGTVRIVALQSVDIAVRHGESFAFNNDGA